MGSRIDLVVGFFVVGFDVWEVWWCCVVWMIVPKAREVSVWFDLITYQVGLVGEMEGKVEGKGEGDV